MNSNTTGWQWRQCLWLLAIWFLIPGGTLIVIAWLLLQEVHVDKELSAYYDASFGEFMARKRKQKEAEHDVHPISNQ
jgi:hypothetical protein